MKIILFTLVSTLLFFTTHGGYTKEEMDEFKGVHGKCTQESGIDPKIALKDISEGADNKEFKCFLKCMMVEFGNMDGTSGALDIDNIKAQKTDLDPAIWGKAVDTCKDLDDADLCEKAFKVTQCMVEDILKQTA